MEKENVDQMTIGQRIKYFRKRKGYTQKEIGELLGFANTSAGTRIAQYETGVRRSVNCNIKTHIFLLYGIYASLIASAAA